MKQYEIFFTIFLLSFLFQNIKSQNECDGCDSKTATSCSSSTGSSCNSYCRPKYFSGELKCIYCNFNGENFYKINTLTCTPIAITDCGDGKKIVQTINECVSRCDINFFELGDYCYISQPANTECNINNECHCKYKFYKTNDGNNKQNHICLPENTDCPSSHSYYDYETNECGNDISLCGTKKIKVEINTQDNSIKYRCSQNCFSNEKISNIASKDYCIDICTYPKNKYYYPDESDKTKMICIEDCSSKNLYELNNECVSSCGATNVYIENNICVESCSSGFYKEENSIKKCLDTASALN